MAWPAAMKPSRENTANEAGGRLHRAGREPGRCPRRLPAQRLLERLLEIEQAHGRTRPGYNAPRTLDLDLLLYGSEQIGTASLTVPHPRMTQRAFVLIPLLQIAPLIDIPGKGPAHGFVPDVANQAISVIRN
jgi:2-amino-4-hydroxy-6-hydroxymethyldihydropteridine diphosphokinase